MLKVISSDKAQHDVGINDVFTEADVHIQNTIVYNLKQLYPRATVIGEEDEQDGKIFQQKPYIMPDQLNRNQISQKLLLNNFNK